MGKDYSRHQARRFVEDEEVGGPPGWNAFTPSSDYTITLFAFSWGLLPVGFMFMMLVFDRFEQHRLVVAAASLAMLVLAFFTGASQRRGSLQDGRVQLAAASLATAVVLLLLVWQLNLAEWWWTVYGTVFGSVPLMYIALITSLNVRRRVCHKRGPLSVLFRWKHWEAGGFNLLGG